MHHLAAPSSRSKTLFSLLMLPLVVLTFSTLRSSLAIWNSWPNALLLPIRISTKANSSYLASWTHTCMPRSSLTGKYTFPIEQKFNDPTFAMEWYSKLPDTMLSEGITAAQYFPTTHVEATMLLFSGKSGSKGVGGLGFDGPERSSLGRITEYGEMFRRC
ncbi:Guanine deaminase [Phytophthora megakarya]|uniref:Guanine deaminase n=1 Tax=Phytophthora megakarya TaxID=4795 RepID=A0A225VCM7_9STRA|nr:Guanine deaminase [Phytophthora megakarya]